MVKQRAQDRNEERHPSPIDIYVGSRIRLRRTLAGISQGQLAGALGLTFQQVQKYEHGTNRVGASRLFEISRTLNVPISYFFDDMPAEISNSPPSGPRGRTPGGVNQPQLANSDFDHQFARRETLDLIRFYYGISDHTKRKLMIDLMASLASSRRDQTAQM